MINECRSNSDLLSPGIVPRLGFLPLQPHLLSSCCCLFAWDYFCSGSAFICLASFFAWASYCSNSAFFRPASFFIMSRSTHNWQKRRSQGQLFEASRENFFDRGRRVWRCTDMIRASSDVQSLSVTGHSQVIIILDSSLHSRPQK